MLLAFSGFFQSEKRKFCKKQNVMHLIPRQLSLILSVSRMTLHSLNRAKPEQTQVFI